MKGSLTAPVGPASMLVGNVMAIQIVMMGLMKKIVVSCIKCQFDCLVTINS